MFNVAPESHPVAVSLRHEAVETEVAVLGAQTGGRGAKPLETLQNPQQLIGFYVKSTKNHTKTCRFFISNPQILGVMEPRRGRSSTTCTLRRLFSVLGLANT